MLGEVIEASTDKENTKLDAYNALSVVCALIFGFATSILHNDLQAYDGIIVGDGNGDENRAAHVAIVLGSIATGASMLSSLEFVMELYHGKKLLHKYGVQSHQAFSSNPSNKLNKKISRICLTLSLCCLLGQIIARCFASNHLPREVAYVTAGILASFFLATIVMQTSDSFLVDKIIKEENVRNC
uniref:Uncharacterized protein n=1 Tax=Chaetoceros debilis TaxID=122233 RepID=A0A7S3PWC7_9STRA|mmetsp:Transcript_4111/g.6054  ORF Transcript_4111/g.6054 Transcript_4111/m.6054 type:complete len:185 (+) Transcript_4111:76-630(+)|eukprot:CAMPEP_0194085884 /NCGR_PEP_ID=MMETSP0149-20130528/19159_1 /TAXON_ID=122233 /ORGANISM="Chaetoceros debilis, Strain MM31A-1" /LENGTH=184 /DNA_ID=CAMNT_0038768871 /DNA_START=15 /DNA_END=569 /DNA_ORIENTATION=+